MAPAEGVSAAEVRATCGCAVDRYAADGGSDPIDPGRVRVQLGGPLIACATRQAPTVTAALARRIAEGSPPLVPPVTIGDDSKPTETPAPPPAERPKRDGPDFGTWFRSLSLPAWLGDSGMPLWAWVPLLFLAFLLPARPLPRPRGRDLIGPPPSKRLGARPTSPAPRRPDPPQRS